MPVPGPCKVQHFMLRATSASKLGQSRRLAARLASEVRNNPPSMYQSRCQCAACRQPIPPVPFAVHQLLAHEKPGQTLDTTALVHEAYLRLVDTDKVQEWNSRWHFFAAAA